MLDAADDLVGVLLRPHHGVVERVAEHAALDVLVHVHLVRGVDDTVTAQHLPCGDGDTDAVRKSREKRRLKYHMWMKTQE